MALWQRIRNNKLKIASTQFHRCYIQLPHAYSFNSTPKPRPLGIPHPYWAFRDTPSCVFNSVRFFAAPVQFQSKWKKEEDSTNGRRLNDQIKAQYVRLVMDDGHSIVSRFEALERARKLKLDLVEVQRNANPPVCKIMDYHKETYKKQEKEKERAKSKSEVTLRKGECKEVRFSEKTEVKDLKMKADMVKKLMEKGYRVKCRATGNENQDLTGALSRLHALIEDVSVVESGPNLAKKEAFMIVRHVKYGPSKKGGAAARKLQDAAHMAANGHEDNMETLTGSSSDSIEYENQSFAESGFVTEEEVGGSDKNIRDWNNAWSSDYQNNTTSDSVSPAESENRYKRADRPSESKVRSHAQAPSSVTENRYKRAEPRNRFQQRTLNNTHPNNNGPGIRDAVRSIPSMNHTRHVPADTDVNRKAENTNQTITSGSRYSRPSLQGIPKHGPSHPTAPNTPRPSYGTFSTTKDTETRSVQGGTHRNREGNSQDSTWQPFSRDSR